MNLLAHHLELVVGKCFGFAEDSVGVGIVVQVLRSEAGVVSGIEQDLFAGILHVHLL